MQCGCLRQISYSGRYEDISLEHLAFIAFPQGGKEESKAFWPEFHLLLFHTAIWHFLKSTVLRWNCLKLESNVALSAPPIN